MIPKGEILTRMREWRLAAAIIEKDYVLGWFLAAFALHPETSRTWVFKGGSCLKKCFFETYRFSEDLDFTLRPEAVYQLDELTRILRDVATLVTEQSGISVPLDRVRLLERRDKLGRPTFMGKIAYQGPLQAPNWPTLTFDITAHEPLLAQSAARPIAHAYPDPLPEHALVPCYSLEELLAEKTRALFERTRPRDLYDVAYIATNAPETLDLSRARELFRLKCDAKKFVAPSLATLADHVRSSPELRADWKDMLAHQIAELPPIDAYLDRLDTILAWLEPTLVPPLPRVTAAGPVAWGPAIRGMSPTSAMERVRFAGSNLLLVTFTYKGRSRLVEPYSLRYPNTGNVLLYGWDTSASQIKAFKFDEILSLTVTNQSFVPRYHVELVGW